ncbi:MAG TPA: hypothetical protein VK666_13200 [Chryseolinea sp.]|nr:hypothetical protein [Chryseolinea sp.]
MKLPFIALLICANVVAHTQKIRSEIDKFTNEKRCETGWIQIRPTMSAPLAAKLRSVGTSIFITLAGSNVGSNVIGSDATTVFLLDDQSTVTITSTGIQDYDIVEHGKAFKHQYRVSKEDLVKLSTHSIISIRKNDSETYHDFDVADKNKDKLKKTAIAFLEEMDK